MNGCVYRTEDNKCKFWSDYGKGIVSYCDPCDCEEKTMSNADKIRAMTDEELADFLDRWEMGDVDYSKTFCDLCDGQYDCHDDCLRDWLKAPVEVQK